VRLVAAKNGVSWEGGLGVGECRQNGLTAGEEQGETETPEENFAGEILDSHCNRQGRIDQRETGTDLLFHILWV
jgi:hypothetical protein